MTAPVLYLRGVTRIADERPILRDLDWQVHPGERWVVLGRNGCGKTTLLRIASLYLHPSSGHVTVLGETLGRCDVRRLRERVGFSSASFADMLRPAGSATRAAVGIGGGLVVVAGAVGAVAVAVDRSGGAPSAVAPSTVGPSPVGPSAAGPSAAGPSADMIRPQP